LSLVKRLPPLEILLAVRAPAKKALEVHGLHRLKSIAEHALKEQKVTFEYTPEHFNWKRTVDFKKLDLSGREPNHYSTGHCGMIYTDCGVLSNGDFTICAWLDVYGDGRLGNIYKDTPDKILKNREAVIQEQNKGTFNNICKYCKFYVPSKGVDVSKVGEF